MYSGSTLTNYSGQILGAHQKINRTARKHLSGISTELPFPTIKHILHFEGANGPDGIKRKSPAKDEPWHYILPFDETDDNLIKIISDHYSFLVQALAAKDMVRAAFEAAWLSHALVDGLTPAHHYPYGEKLIELRGGAGLETRNTIKQKIVLPGENWHKQVGNNWKMWGPKGLFITHAGFEWGFATVILPLRLQTAIPTAEDIMAFHEQGLASWYRSLAQDIANHGMYENFYKEGWTRSLAGQIRRYLAPTIVRAVTVAWQNASIDAARLVSERA